MVINYNINGTETERAKLLLVSYYNSNILKEERTDGQMDGRTDGPTLLSIELLSQLMTHYYMTI